MGQPDSGYFFPGIRTSRNPASRNREGGGRDNYAWPEAAAECLGIKINSAATAKDGAYRFKTKPGRKATLLG